MKVKPDSSKIAILLGTYNGEAYLKEQLNSFEWQTYSDWHLFISDDGSNDKTFSILRQFREKHQGRVNIKNGPRRGFAANFLNLACDEEIDAGFYAFSDQDDIWEADKLERAVLWLKNVPENCPALFCSRSQLIDDAGKEIGFCKTFNKGPSFSNALVQNIANGHTIVFNRAARELLIKASADVSVPSHDWWLYLIVSAAGGQIKYDFYPTVRYRQHGKNIIGYDLGTKRFFKRLIGTVWMLKNFKSKVDMNVNALKSIYSYMTETNQKILKQFIEARQLNIFKRIFIMYKSGIFRQTTIGNLELFVAVLANQI
jgi:glycosyltransferase involved in cell wall biosynthesis